MNKEERKILYDRAEKLWGLVAQYDQAIEEMGELIVAINKFKRKCLYGEYNGNEKIIDNLVEEIADVKMCIEQLEGFMGEDKVEAVLDQKMQKFLGQIEEMSKLKQENN